MFAPIDEVLADLRAGKMIVLTDDESRENEGDLVLPVQFVTPQAITFMLSVARGYMCVSLTEADCDRLHLHPQSAVNNTVRGTAFTVSLDGHPRHGFTTGVSAKERARCIQMLIDPAFGPDDFVRPGHINPLRSRTGGTLVRTGQTEGSLDLCRLAGLYPAAVIIEIMRDDGEMARVPDLVGLARQHDLKMCSVAQIIAHRLTRESLVKRLEPIAGTPLRTAHGPFTAYAYESIVDPLPHLVLTVGGVGGLSGDPSLPSDHRRVPPSDEPTLVRMHRRHLLGDVFGDLDSAAEPTGATLHAAMRMLQQEGKGALVYLRTQGRLVGPAHRATDELEGLLQSPRRGGEYIAGADDPQLMHEAGPAATVLPMTQRDFGIGVQILRDLGLSKLRLITNHPRPLPGLDAFGLEVVERVALERAPIAPL